MPANGSRWASAPAARKNPLSKTNPVLTLAANAARRLPGPVKRLLYQIKPLAGWIRGMLNRAAPEGLVPVTIAAGILEGWQAVLNLKTEKDYWLGTYEPDLQQAIGEFIQPGMTVYDVGANIGLVALMFARAAGSEGKVIAIEALPANVQRLRENSALNTPHAPIEIVEAAAGDSLEPQTFLVHNSTSMGKTSGSAGRDEQYQTSITVAGTTLDHLAYQAGYPLPDAVKMDIEGGEVLAIPGMTRLLREAKPLMLIEVHGTEAGGVVYEALTAAGYKLHHMRSGYPPVRNRAELDWKAYIVALPA